MNFQASEYSEQDFGFLDWLTQGAVATGGVVGSWAASTVTADPASITGIAVNVLPLRRGSKGPQVRQLQTVLKESGNDPGKVDGDFGAMTEAAVRAFQRARQIPETGVVDERTLGLLSALLMNVRSGGAKDVHVAKTAPPTTQISTPPVTTDPTQKAFYEQPWFLPATIGTGLVIAAAVGYFALRKR